MTDKQLSKIQKIVFIVLGIVFGIVLVIFGIYSYRQLQQKSKELSKKDAIFRQKSLQTDEIMVNVTNEGFIPKTLAISQKGNKIIIFRNTGPNTIWITSSYPNFSVPEIPAKSEYVFGFAQLGLWNVQIQNQKNKTINIIVR